MPEERDPGSDTVNLKSRELDELLALMRAQRRARMWDLGFRIVKYVVVIAVVIGLMVLSSRTSMQRPALGVNVYGNEPHLARVRVEGLIAFDTSASSDSVGESLRSAFEHNNTAAVLIEIDSPGGSPVHAGEIYDEIMRLRKLHPDVTTVSLIRDLGASGAYYIAVATEKIYANRASLVGSIGVISGGFGFQGLLEKIGVERRLYTAGQHKGFLDPFLPEQSKERAAWEGVLRDVQEQFVSRVKTARAHLVKDRRAYTGLLWSGERAQEIGLVDYLGDANAVLDRLGLDVMVDFTVEPPYLESLIERFGGVLASAFASQRVKLLSHGAQ